MISNEPILKTKRRRKPAAVVLSCIYLFSGGTLIWLVIENFSSLDWITITIGLFIGVFGIGIALIYLFTGLLEDLILTSFGGGS